MAARSTPARAASAPTTASSSCRAATSSLVTINYRLGALGFLNLQRRDAMASFPAPAPKDSPTRSRRCAWVKENIASFGGDPDNVTIFGESAGGMSVGALLASPAARGLFHKAIPQSGASDIGYDRETSANASRRWWSTSSAPIRCAATWEAILDVQKADPGCAARDRSRHAVRADHRRRRAAEPRDRMRARRARRRACPC